MEFQERKDAHIRCVTNIIKIIWSRRGGVLKSVAEMDDEMLMEVKHGLALRSTLQFLF